MNYPLIFHPKAEEEYRKASSIDPNNVKWETEIGKLYAKQNKWPEAEASFQKALLMDPSNSSLHAVLGNAMHHQQKWKEAETEYKIGRAHV